MVGEFSAQTNICVLPDGTVVPGTNIAGAQCSASTSIWDWNPALVNATRKYLEAQLDTFEANTQGWFMWTYKGPGAWSIYNLFVKGVMGPHSVTDRVFPPQCN